MIKENWYELEDEEILDADDRSTPVLYTSKSGLSALIKEMQRIELSDSAGKVPIDIQGMDYTYSVPFTHIEILEKPPESGGDDSSSCWKPFILGFVVVSVLLLLSGYGLVRLIMDLV